MATAKPVGKSTHSAIYVVPDDQLAVGSTLGGPKVETIVKATGAIEKVYSIDFGETVFGTIMLRHYDGNSGIFLSQEAVGTFSLHAAHQCHNYRLTNDVDVTETIFVLSSKTPGGDEVDPPAVYYSVELENLGSDPAEVVTYVYALLRGTTPQDVEAEFDEKSGTLVAWNKSHPEWVRILGASEPLLSYETTLDYAIALHDRCPGELSNTTQAPREPLAVAQLAHHLDPGESATWSYIMSVGNGREEALSNYHAAPKAEDALSATCASYQKLLERSVVMTPDSSVNRGCLWAKANMLRVELKAPTGWCFTNDPTRSNNSVGRDTAWFGFGADYFTPEFVRDSLLAYCRLQEPDGMMIEYYDIRNGKTADYGLNINDNTPLLIMAYWHHYRTTGDRHFLEQVYPSADKAARYILSQRNNQGLVWSTASGQSDWGIVGWRNVIPGYNLSGATTEVNSECYAALMTISHMARVLGKHQESAKFEQEAEDLKKAINSLLLDPKTDLYYLNIDQQGNVHTDITSDLVFPVMFGVAEPKVAAHIIAKLSGADFWTSAGMRTTPRGSPTYSPEAGWGLLGGIWVGVSFWYASAAASFSPAFMAYALGQTFHNYSTDPRGTNTVPGQFSEWLNGETLVNQGMMLSPWFPPRYVWAAIEGMAGLSSEGQLPTLSPHLAPQWKWLAAHNVPYRDRHLTWITARIPHLHIYSNFPLTEEPIDHTAYSDDITCHMRASGDSVSAVGLRQDQNLLLFAGNSEDRTVTTYVGVDLTLSGTYRVRTYNSLLESWTENPDSVTPDEIRRGIMVELERNGFVLLDLRQET